MINIANCDNNPVSLVNKVTKNPGLNLLAAIVKSAIQEGDALFFCEDWGKEVCETLGFTPEYGLKMLDIEQKERQERELKAMFSSTKKVELEVNDPVTIRFLSKVIDSACKYYLSGTYMSGDAMVEYADKIVSGNCGEHSRIDGYFTKILGVLEDFYNNKNRDYTEEFKEFHSLYVKNCRKFSNFSCYLAA